MQNAFITYIRNTYKSDQLIFMNKASKDERNLSCGYGYSEINTHTQKKNVFIRGIQYTILSALFLDGIIATKIINNSCNQQTFKEFVISQVVYINFT